MAALGWLLNLGFSGSDAADTAPVPFTFVDVNNQALGTVIESNTIILAGFDTATNLTWTETGHLSGLYSLNGAAYLDLATVSVSNGNTIRLKLTSSTSAETSVSITATVGGVSDQWDVLTSIIENTGATTRVPSNYEICERSGFRVWPGELQMQWMFQP